MVEEEGEESEEEEEGEGALLSAGKRVCVKGSETSGSSSALKRYWKSSEFDISSTFASGTLSKFIFVVRCCSCGVVVVSVLSDDESARKD